MFLIRSDPASSYLEGSETINPFGIYIYIVFFSFFLYTHRFGSRYKSNHRRVWEPSNLVSGHCLVASVSRGARRRAPCAACRASSERARAGAWRRTCAPRGACRAPCDGGARGRHSGATNKGLQVPWAISFDKSPGDVQVLWVSSKETPGAVGAV